MHTWVSVHVFCLCVHVCAHVCVWLVCFCVQCCVLCVCGCVWLDWLKVTQLACESGLSRAQTTGLSKKPQPSSQMLADVLPDGLGETCEQAGAVISLPRGSRDEPVVFPRGRQRPPRPQTGPQGKRSRGRAGGGGGGGTLQRALVLQVHPGPGEAGLSQGNPPSRHHTALSSQEAGDLLWKSRWCSQRPHQVPGSAGHTGQSWDRSSPQREAETKLLPSEDAEGTGPARVGGQSRPLL